MSRTVSAADDTFEAFVASRGPALLRSATLLTGEPSSAQRLVQAALVHAAGRWDHLCARGNPEQSVRSEMVRASLSPRRMRRRPGSDVLAPLTRRQRAVVVLMDYDGSSETTTAELLGWSVGTVRSQAAKAHERLGAGHDPSDLRHRLTAAADAGPPLDLSDRVAVDVRRQRRRRRWLTVLALAAVVGAAAAAVVVVRTDDRSDVPEDQAQGRTVALDTDASDQIERPLLAVLVALSEQPTVLDQDGRQHALRVDTGIPAATALSWSRDGRWLALAGDTAVGPLISVVDVDAALRGRQSVAGLPAPETAQQGPLRLLPAVSPDGTYVALALEDVDGYDTALVLARRDRSQTRVVELTGGWDFPLGSARVEWSGDGTRLLLSDLLSTGPARVAVLDVADAFSGSAIEVEPVVLRDVLSAVNGFAASADLSEVVVGELDGEDGTRTFTKYSTATGGELETYDRSPEDVLIGWRAGGSLVWFRPAWSDPFASQVLLDDTVVLALDATESGAVRLAAAPQGVSAG